MSAEHGHSLIGITGAIRNGDLVELENHRRMIRPFRTRGFEISLHDVIWRDPLFTVEDKIGVLSEVIEGELEKGKEVSLLGFSAGGALALAGFMEHPEITGVIIYGARINKQTAVGYPPLDDVKKKTPLFADTIDWITDHAASLTPEMRTRVMTRRSEHGDDVVPHDAHILEGAHNIVDPFRAMDHYDAVNRTARRSYDEVTVFLRGISERRR